MLSEDEQLSIVRALTVTDPSPDPESDELLRYVARACKAPIALLALVGRSRLWFKSRLGIEVTEAPKFVLPKDLEVIEDAARDPRGAGEPLLALVPGARFLAVAPLHEGHTEVGVVAIPSVVFYDNTDAGRSQVRFAFCKKQHVLAEALSRLARAGRGEGGLGD